MAIQMQYQGAFVGYVRTVADVLELQGLVAITIQPTVPQPMACAVAFNADISENLANT